MVQAEGAGGNDNEALYFTQLFRQVHIQDAPPRRQQAAAAVSGRKKRLGCKLVGRVKGTSVGWWNALGPGLGEIPSTETQSVPETTDTGDPPDTEPARTKSA